MTSKLRKLIQEELKSYLNEAAAQVRDEQYVFSHGKKPTGTGSWAFRFEKNRNGTDGEIWWVPNNMPYAKAVKAAQEEAKKSGSEFIFVMP